MLRILTSCFFICLTLSGQAQEALSHKFSAAELQYMEESNRTMALFEKQNPTLFADALDVTSFSLLSLTDVRPFAEYEDAGYLIFSETFDFESKEAKLAMAKNLPVDARLVVYTGSTNKRNARKIRKTFSGVIDQDRLSVVYMPKGARGFWARDGVPVPVWRWAPGEAEQLTVVDAKYYHKFEPDQQFASLFNAELTNHQYFFEGGNFMANSKNECLVVNTQATSVVPDSVFLAHYGCRVLVRLPFVKGIGHADESVKFIDDHTVLTDEKSYVPLLESKGFDVVMLPRPKLKYETYVNSLMINGVVYVPIFGRPSDQKALAVYRSMGFEKVIGLRSDTLSNRGMGSLHCITMTYPKVPMSELLHSMGGSLL